MYVYKWDKTPSTVRDPARLPVLTTTKKWTKKTSPGISSFNHNPEAIGPDHLRPLFDHALKYIDKDEVSQTPVFLLATAGMRLLPSSEREAILKNICSYTRKHTQFHLPDCKEHIQVIPGNTEGLFGWMAANYLIGGFDHPQEHNHGKGHHTYGFLDMGGASSQIAFIPNGTESEKHANDLTLLRLRRSDGYDTEYRIFSTTWLGAGVNQARERYINLLLDSVDDGAKEVPDPCLPKGLSLETDRSTVGGGSVTSKTLVGTGQFSECERASYPLLGKDAPCPDEPCMVSGVHMPGIDFDIHHFVGVSEYWYSTHGFFDLQHTDPKYDFVKYQKDANQLCSRPWSELMDALDRNEWSDPEIDERKLTEVCFKAGWVMNMLHNGIGVPKVGYDPRTNLTLGLDKTKSDKVPNGFFLDPFKAINRINEMEVSWTLGKILLYASAQVPALDKARSKPVGYGPNVVGVESTALWTPGSAAPPVASSPHSNSSSGWHNSVLSDYSPRRVPGFLLFSGLILVIGFFLFGKRRRRSVYSKFSSVFDSEAGTGHGHGHGSKPSPLRRALSAASATFGSASSSTSSSSRSKQNYVSVPEIDLEDPLAFELDMYDSENSASASSSSPVGRGRTSRPSINHAIGSSSSASLFNTAATQPVVRAESTDLLSIGPGVVGQVRSRQTSPARSRR